MSESAPTIEYATSTVAHAHATPATRIVAWMGIVVGLTGLIWTGMMWRMYHLDDGYGLGNLVRSAKPQVMPFDEAMKLHVWAEGILALVLLGASLAHLITPRSVVPVYGMRSYAIGMIAYAGVLTVGSVIVRRQRFWTYDEEGVIRFASIWIPRQVHELVYAAFVLFFVRVRRRRGQTVDLASA